MDAIELLKKDHQEVTKLFQRFSTGKGGRAANGVVAKICDELDVHSLIEEEIFYPAVRPAGRELASKVDESLREHARIKEQVAELRREMEGGADADLEPRVMALQQDVEHHVTEEEGEMFPRVAEQIDERERTELGERLAARKRELGGEMPSGRARGRKRSQSRTAIARSARAKARRQRGKSQRAKSKTRRSRTSATRSRTRTTKTSRTKRRGRGSSGRKRASGGRRR